MKEARLERSVTLPFLVLYGVGTIVGGGFYALLGKVAGEAGLYAPVALLVTGLVALPISPSFAEVSSRFPVSAGEARYVQAGLGRLWLVTAIVLALPLFFPLTTLARATSSIILVVFALVCLSLWRIGRREPDRSGKGPRFPGWVPLAGAVTCAAALVVGLWQWLG